LALQRLNLENIGGPITPPNNLNFNKPVFSKLGSGEEI
jgi:hypothetical protein